MHDNDFLFSFPERQLAHFRVPPGHLYQNEVKFCAFDIEMMFHSQANTTHFHKKDYALGLILKVRIFGTRKWPINKKRGSMRFVMGGGGAGWAPSQWA